MTAAPLPTGRRGTGESERLFRDDGPAEYGCIWAFWRAGPDPGRCIDAYSCSKSSCGWDKDTDPDGAEWWCGRRGGGAMPGYPWTI